MSGAQLRVALGEYDIGWHAPEPSLGAAAILVGQAARAGARLVVLPEMMTTGFTMDATMAVPLDARPVQRLSELAADHGVWLVAGVALQEEGCAVNAALAIDDTGHIAAVHRKRRLFAYAGEHDVYRAGRTPTQITIDGVRIALFICYELRFPELFAPVAAEVDAMVVIANWPAARRAHWDVLLRARAVDSQCTVIGVNRIGTGGGIEYDGGSAAYGPWGDSLPVDRAAGVPVVTVDTGAVAAVRERYPFLRDRELR